MQLLQRKRHRRQLCFQPFRAAFRCSLSMIAPSSKPRRCRCRILEAAMVIAAPGVRHGPTHVPETEPRLDAPPEPDGPHARHLHRRVCRGVLRARVAEIRDSVRRQHSQRPVPRCRWHLPSRPLPSTGPSWARSPTGSSRRCMLSIGGCGRACGGSRHCPGCLEAYCFDSIFCGAATSTSQNRSMPLDVAPTRLPPDTKLARIIKSPLLSSGSSRASG